jgi:hypothetical protein
MFFWCKVAKPFSRLLRSRSQHVQVFFLVFIHALLLDMMGLIELEDGGTGSPMTTRARWSSAGLSPANENHAQAERTGSRDSLSSQCEKENFSPFCLIVNGLFSFPCLVICPKAACCAAEKSCVLDGMGLVRCEKGVLD